MTDYITYVKKILKDYNITVKPITNRYLSASYGNVSVTIDIHNLYDLNTIGIAMYVKDRFKNNNVFIDTNNRILKTYKKKYKSIYNTKSKTKTKKTKYYYDVINNLEVKEKKENIKNILKNKYKLL